MTTCFKSLLFFFAGRSTSSQPLSAPGSPRLAASLQALPAKLRRQPPGESQRYTAGVSQQGHWGSSSASQSYSSGNGGPGSYSDSMGGDVSYSDGGGSQRRRQCQVAVHCGNWSHDLDQARLLEGIPQVQFTAAL